MGQKWLLMAGVASALAMSFVPAAFAGPFTTVDTSVQTQSVASTWTDWNQTLSFAQFNGSLGQLQSLTLEVTDTLDATLSVTGTAVGTNGRGATGKATDEAFIGLTDPANLFATDIVNGAPLELVFDTNNTVVSGLLQTISKSPGFGPLAINETVQLIPNGTVPGTTDSGPTVLSDAATLAEFTGNGSIDLTASSAADASVTISGGNAKVTQVTKSGITATLFYTYIPEAELPEPLSLALLASGMAAVTLVRRRVG